MHLYRSVKYVSANAPTTFWNVRRPTSMSRSLAVVLDAVLYIYCGSIKSPFCSSRFLLHPALPRPCPSLHGEYTAGPSVALHVAGAYSDRDRLRPPYPPPPSSSHPRIHSPFCDSPQLILAVHHPPSPAKTLHSPSTSYHDPPPAPHPPSWCRFLQGRRRLPFSNYLSDY